MTIYVDSAEKGACRLCGQPIYWALTHPNRKRAPLDAPLSTRNLRRSEDDERLADVASSTHFETCPNYRASAKPITQHSLFAPPENPT